jgi:hypothetical protein
MANPRRRRRSRKANRSHVRRSRRSNPMFGKRHRSFRRHSRRSNPGVAGFSANELIKLAGGAAVGVVGSKYLAQLALGGNNTGPMGYAGQSIATLALAWAANKFGLGGKDVATGIVAGGIGAVALSIFNDYVGASGSVSGLGDVAMSRFLGDFQNKSISVPAGFNSPVAVVPSGTSQARGRTRG